MANVEVLRQAVPYIRRYKGTVFVLKVGGNVAQRPEVLEGFARDVTVLHQLGISVCVVHGGGPQATELSQRLGHEVKIVAGRRITDEDTLEVAKMVFGGKINLEVLSALRWAGTRAVGVSGVDGQIIRARRRPAREVRDEATGEAVVVDFGHVGDIEGVDVHLLRTLMDAAYVPVVASLGADEEGRIYNINADTVASAIAVALAARKLIVLSDVPGVLTDPARESSRISHLRTQRARELVADGTISKGMEPKVAACIAAVEGGVRRAHLIDGLAPDSLLQEVFTREGGGTLIASDAVIASYEAELATDES